MEKSFLFPPPFQVYFVKVTRKKANAINLRDLVRDLIPE